MWRRRKPAWQSELESSLRRYRAEPSATFIDDLSRRLMPEQPSPRRAWSRLAFAAAISIFILGTFASFGGLSYAAPGATATYRTIEQVVVKHKLSLSVHTSSAASQYPHKPMKPPRPHKPLTTPAAVSPAKTSSPPPAAGSPTVQSGTLPFTGASLLATSLLSLGLIGAGIALRRREHRS